MRVHSRRQRLLRPAAASLPIAAVMVFTASSMPAAPEETISTSADQSTVRLRTVGAALTGGMFQDLIADFEAQSGYTVELEMAGPDIMNRAQFESDIVMVHHGFTPLHEFVTDGWGMFPATVMSNTVAFLIPPGDPAGIRDLDDPFEAFQAIADTESPFIVNNLGETLYVTDTLYNAAGRPDPGDWFIDRGQSGPPAVISASQRGAYTIWGLHPFLNLRQRRDLNLEAVIYNDSLMQRIIATTVVRRPPGLVNEEGALALQTFLTDSATQANIRAFRLPPFDEDDDHPDIDEPIFWPAGNQNDN